jgi:hypothetical protein
MRRIIILCCLLGWFCVQGQGLGQNAWLTVIGDPEDQAVNTIEVNPVAVAAQGQLRTMKIRVSRSEQRVSRDGVAFRSFEAEVVFDCARDRARFISADFYRLPLWQGESHKSLVYPNGSVRPMEFRDIEPNPRNRLIRAACTGAGATKR